jgi:hypothetical protein
MPTRANMWRSALAMRRRSALQRHIGALVLACICATTALAETDAGPALESVPADMQVLHCGLSKGVLYITYARDGRAAIAPAFHTPAIRKACAAAGYPLAAGPPERLATPAPASRIGITPPPVLGASARSSSVAEPSFSAQASGSVITIDGRNDADVAFHCVINFAWTSDDEPGGSRGVTTQATLPARQSNRVVFISGPYRNVRFVGQPRWNCRPDG